jgi:hypothetical protein
MFTAIDDNGVRELVSWLLQDRPATLKTVNINHNFRVVMPGHRSNGSSRP